MDVVASLARNFQKHVTPGEPGECWNWQGGPSDPTQYGTVGAGVEGKHMYAHRAAYILAHGPIPKGQWVLHRCDNVRCVNPAHLYLGDRSRNMKDAYERGRIDMHKVASAPRPGGRKHGKA